MNVENCEYSGAIEFASRIHNSTRFKNMWNCSSWEEFVMWACEECIPVEFQTRAECVRILLEEYQDILSGFEGRTLFKLQRALSSLHQRISETPPPV